MIKPEDKGVCRDIGEGELSDRPVELTKESVSEYEVVLDTTLTVPLVLCPFCVASTVYVPVSVTVKATVPVLVLVCKVEPPFLSVTVEPEGAVTLIVAE